MLCNSSAECVFGLCLQDKAAGFVLGLSYRPAGVCLWMPQLYCNLCECATCVVPAVLFLLLFPKNRTQLKSTEQRKSTYHEHKSGWIHRDWKHIRRYWESHHCTVNHISRGSSFHSHFAMVTTWTWHKNLKLIDTGCSDFKLQSVSVNTNEAENVEQVFCCQHERTIRWLMIPSYYWMEEPLSQVFKSFCWLPDKYILYMKFLLC